MSFSNYYQQHNRSQIESSEENKRLSQDDLPTTWRHWGPYLSERQWGTVREWYDAEKDPWTDFIHDHARSRAYRWGEDGIAGISDLQQLLCFSIALWNEKDPILKERLFGLTNAEGNHGEDVKEYYYYLDNTPTHSYMKYLYKYPYEYPYADLVDHSHRIDPMEYELIDTGALENNSYFDVFVEYAKNDPEDILVRLTVVNRGNETRKLHLLPTLWFRNTWSWSDPPTAKPSLSAAPSGPLHMTIEASEVAAADSLSGQNSRLLSGRWLYCAECPELLFTENETNLKRFNWGNNPSPYVKDGINNHIVANDPTVNPARRGTKAAAHYTWSLAPHETRTVTLRLCDRQLAAPFDADFDRIFAQRQREADAFYDAICPYDRQGDERNQDLYRVQRQAFAGMLWSKQFFHLVAHRWLIGDRLPASAKHQTDAKLTPWTHLYCKDVLSMPDTWEYPWFAAWDLAFHTTTFAIIDPAFAKYQLELLVMEWYQHPNGQIPAYEWDFSNINPPVHAWAAWRVYQTEQEIYGRQDTHFLERIFSKLNMNFTWWVNKVDAQGNNVFEGGFLGMDNIRIVDRDPSGKPIEQADGTAWMAMFCLNMVRIAIELAELHGGANSDEAYQYKDAARKYLQHFMYICDAMNRVAKDGLWDEDAGFFMDCANNYGRLKVFSMVGFVPLFAVEQIVQSGSDPDSFYDLCGWLRWFARNRKDLVKDNAMINFDQLVRGVTSSPPTVNATVSVVDDEKLQRVLQRLLNPAEFLSKFGIRGLSKFHLDHHDVTLGDSGPPLYVAYECAESITMRSMGGNSNWCGPIWMPVNYLLVDALRRHHRGFRDATGAPKTVKCPTGSGTSMTLDAIADELSWRLVNAFLRDPVSKFRPVFGGQERFQNDPEWKDYLLFYEYFHGGDRNDQYAGAGLGASHQTGWTGLVANLIQELGVRERARALNLSEDP